MQITNLKTIINSSFFFSYQEKNYWFKLIESLKKTDIDRLTNIITIRTENIEKIKSEKEKKDGVINLKYLKILDNFKKKGINKYLKKYEKEDQEKTQKEADKLIN